MISLGLIRFQDFEVPAEVRFGGTQRMVVHDLPGGGRVIDTLGPKEDDVTWSGILTGADAVDRARLLDAVRADGSPSLLTWNAFSATVVVARIEFGFRNPWWIPYRISCRVSSQPLVPAAEPTLTSLLLADVTRAGAVSAVAALPAMLSIAGATTRGTPAYAAATNAFAGSLDGISAAIVSAEGALVGDAIPDLVTAAGSLAQLTLAQGYTARAAANLANASS